MHEYREVVDRGARSPQNRARSVSINAGAAPDGAPMAPRGPGRCIQSSELQHPQGDRANETGSNAKSLQDLGPAMIKW